MSKSELVGISVIHFFILDGVMTSSWIIFSTIFLNSILSGDWSWLRFELQILDVYSLKRWRHHCAIVLFAFSQLFNLLFSEGANGDGMAIVSSLRSFDREQQKEYEVPIVIKDSGNPSMSGTSTLTIIIGDSNDNKMQPGSKEILVYNYMVKTFFCTWYTISSKK